MSGTIEIVFNEHLAAELRKKHSDWAKPDVIRAEHTGVLVAAGQRPDIVVCDDVQFPVALETEFAPANTVESDAIARIGQNYIPTGGTIYSSLAVKVPQRYRKLSGTGIGDAIRDEREFEYCLFYGDSAADSHRWPKTGFVSASLDDLAFAISSARASPHLVNEAASVLEEGAKRVAAILGAAAAKHPGLPGKLAECLKQEASVQTYRMAATILINAFVFQETIQGGEGDLGSIASTYELGSAPSKLAILNEWKKILNIDYWPIFGVAHGLLTIIPTSIWQDFFTAAFEAADKLLSLNLGRNPDLIGIIFQRLISDRRFLATFYTAPQSAALMCRLVVGGALPHGEAWNDCEAVKKIRIADFACGTGSLLSTVYGEVRHRLESAGVDARALHKSMIENALVGCDVLPSATHITASQLSSAFPTIQYTRTKILTLRFGPTDDGGVALGAIDLLEKQGAMSIIATAADNVSALSDEKIDAWASIGGAAVEDKSFDFIVMNPPFTRLTGGGGKSADVSRPLFAAFGTTLADQTRMSAKARKLTQGTCYHGNAGAASIFVEIAHRKLVKNGTMGLILPLSAFSGSSWEASRQLWRKNYRDLTMLSIAATGDGETAFSADTGVPEAMVIGTRAEVPGTRIVSASLYRRPTSVLEGVEMARHIRELSSGGAVHSLEGGPIGGTPITIGEEKVGEVLTGPVPQSGPWPLFRIRDHSIAQTAFQVLEGKCWLPGLSESDVAELPVCRLGDLGEVGPYHLDISGSGLSGGAARGPFKIKPTKKPDIVTFPVLNAHDESRERFLVIAPDSEGEPRTHKNPAMAGLLGVRRDNIWKTRTRLHFATDLRFNANALVACLTTRESIGGRAWPSFLLNDRRFERVVALWFNSSLGILSYWWIANKAQHGRGSVTTSRISSLALFDPRTLSAAQLKTCDDFFDGFQTKSLKDVFECATDPARAELDEFLVDALIRPKDRKRYCEALELLRNKLVAEPSISG